MRLGYALVVALLAVSLHLAAPPQATPVYGYRVVHVYPHDPNAFTEGLEYRGGFLYEGTGLNGRSNLRKVDLQSGKVLREIRIDSQYFGEGITVFGQRIVELTFRAEKGFVYDKGTFRQIGTFDYPGEGWGLTNDGRQIFMSDGTAEIRCWNPETLREIRRFTVHDGKSSVERLNELEFVRGEIFANVWLTDKIARISPVDGRVTGWIDLTGLFPESERVSSGADVLEGIAYDSLGDRLFVTGKLWPNLFEIQLVRKS
jgi:glutaminyl-peptide cyclotransferase